MFDYAVVDKHKAVVDKYKILVTLSSTLDDSCTTCERQMLETSLYFCNESIAKYGTIAFVKTMNLVVFLTTCTHVRFNLSSLLLIVGTVSYGQDEQAKSAID